MLKALIEPPVSVANKASPQLAHLISVHKLDSTSTDRLNPPLNVSRMQNLQCSPMEAVMHNISTEFN